MNTREIAAEYRLSQWAQIMHERRESGLSIKAYCKQHGFHENVYYYWQRKLREAACTELASRERESETSLVPHGWSRLEAVESTPVESEMTIEINGCRISVSCGTDQALLATVCRTLKAL
jgi:Transposase.